MHELIDVIMAFLTGMLAGVLVMFLIDTKYIRTIQKSHKNILRIMARTYKEREESQKALAKRLYKALAKYQIQEAEAKK